MIKISNTSKVLEEENTLLMDKIKFFEEENKILTNEIGEKNESNNNNQNKNLLDPIDFIKNRKINNRMNSDISLKPIKLFKFNISVKNNSPILKSSYFFRFIKIIIRFFLFYLKFNILSYFFLK